MKLHIIHRSLCDLHLHLLAQELEIQRIYLDCISKDIGTGFSISD